MPAIRAGRMIQVLARDPKAPASEPKMAAKAVIVPEFIEIRPRRQFLANIIRIKTAGRYMIEAASICRAAKFDLRKAKRPLK